MGNKYKESMDKIEVSEEMRARILNNIAQEMGEEEFKEEPVLKEPAKKATVISMQKWRRLSSLAAVFVVLLVGTIAIQHLREPSEVVTTGGMLLAENASEIEDNLGFPVEELKEIPFSITDITYSYSREGLVEIFYTGNENALTFRKSKGTEDNSGDYTDYGNVDTITAAGIEITLKGEEDGYVLAVWNRDGYQYSLASQQPLAADVWVSILENME